LSRPLSALLHQVCSYLGFSSCSPAFARHYIVLPDHDVLLIMTFFSSVTCNCQLENYNSTCIVMLL
jgi:hypothetical protein